MSTDIRRIPLADAEDSQRLAVEAFGVPPTPLDRPTPETWPPPNAHPWGAWVDGTLVAKATTRSFTSWFHGARVPTAGFGGVTVAAEQRGAGHVRALFDAALDEARRRGEVISTLYPSAPGIYRGLGYEVVGALDEVTIPMSVLAAVRRPSGVRTRRARAGDAAVLHGVYSTWARGQNGPLTRDEAPFTRDDADPSAAHGTGVSLAVDAEDRVQGLVRWSRGTGSDRTNAIVVEDMVALTADAARALWAVLGSFSTVAGFVRLTTSGAWSGTDVGRLVLGDHAATTTSRPYMLRLLDVPGALDVAHPGPLTAEVPFAVVDPSAADLEGSWTVRVRDGRPRTVRDGAAPSSPGERPTFTSAGLALSYAGAQSCANLRFAGHLSGPTRYDAVWDALWGSRQVHVRDYF